MASPPPHGAGASVCCMCGDHGLPDELFRCKFCRFRQQHRYCSELYPKATAYRRCNWCLREPADGGGHALAVASKLTGKRKAATSASISTTSDEEKPHRSLEAGCSTLRSRRSAADVGRLVKKQKADERVPMPAGTAKGNNSKKEPMQAGKIARPSRVKVRRYKLLAEVISCS